MKIRPPSVYIIILNYNGWRDTVECLATVYQNSYSNYEVVVVDNGSRDESAEKIKEWARVNEKDPIVITTEKNLGFAGGNNVGIRYALENGGDYALLLNNDTAVEKGFLEELVKPAEKKEDIGIVGGKIYYYKDRDKTWYQRGRLSWLLGGGIHPGKGRYERNGDLGVHEVTFITGCMMLIKKETLERIGLFDESYFLYSEDADYCARALKNCVKMAVSLSSVIYHKERSTVGGWRPSHIYYLVRNRFIFVNKNAPDFGHLMGFYIVAALAGTLLFIWWLAIGRVDLVRASLWAVRDSLAGCDGQSKRDL